MIYWFLIGLAVSIYVVHGPKLDNEEAKRIRKNVKLAFERVALFRAIMIPAYIFWMCVFSLIWPLMIYIRFFHKDK